MKKQKSLVVVTGYNITCPGYGKTSPWQATDFVKN
jgi:hypothetical protein